MTTPADVIDRFVACINRGDVEGLVALMAPRHRFVDSLGGKYDGRDRMGESWRKYFALVPGYRLLITDRFEKESAVVLLGMAEGNYAADGSIVPDSQWSTPVAIRAEIADGLIAVWQIFADNEPLRRRMRAAQRLSLDFVTE
jgi:hypothetical protein